MKRVLAFSCVTIFACAALASSSVATELSPLGNSCTPKAGVLFCPTATLGDRFHTFDGVPLDVDVTLPRGDKGPFPTVLMLHGYLQNKKQFEAESPEGSSGISYHYNNIYFAQKGYAVVNLSARGFGDSCGSLESRTKACAKGWLHFADQRFEVRDAQLVLGTLVDEGVADPGALGVTGLSYGGGQTMQLAFLKNRVRMLDGKLVPWKSPHGINLEIAAAQPRWAWFDFMQAITPNGRTNQEPVTRTSPLSYMPFGVAKHTMLDLLYTAGKAVAFMAPMRRDSSADLTLWRLVVEQGEPYGPKIREIGSQLFRYHGAASISGAPSPLFIANGWTDDIFPATQALQAYNTARARTPNAEVSIALSDIGHFRATNQPGVDHQINEQTRKFFDYHLKHDGNGIRPGTVMAFEQTCDRARTSLRPLTKLSWHGLSSRAVKFGGDDRKIIKPTVRGKASDAEKITPAAGGTACRKVRETRVKDGTSYTRRSSGFTMIGLPTVSANVAMRGVAGQLDARLWDVDQNGRQRLVTWGVYRLTKNQRGRVSFGLQGNAYRFERGHKVKLELAGSNSEFTLPTKTHFRVAVSGVKISLPRSK